MTNKKNTICRRNQGKNERKVAATKTKAKKTNARVCVRIIIELQVIIIQSGAE